MSSVENYSSAAETETSFVGLDDRVHDAREKQIWLVDDYSDMPKRLEKASRFVDRSTKRAMVIDHLELQLFNWGSEIPGKPFSEAVIAERIGSYEDDIAYAKAAGPDDPESLKWLDVEYRRIALQHQDCLAPQGLKTVSQ